MSTAQASDNKGVVAHLEELSQQHESNIVIELGVDRYMRGIGVYLMLTLAIVFKIINYVGPNLSCYPANQITGTDRNFIVFSNAYCWESLHDLNSKHICKAVNVTTDVPILQNPNDLKRLIQWMPYIILTQALLFAGISTWWHYHVGARLMGHLKFMQLLLENIYQKLKSFGQITDEGKPYDRYGEHLDGCRIKNVGLRKITVEPNSNKKFGQKTSNRSSDDAAEPLTKSKASKTSGESRDNGSSASPSNPIGEQATTSNKDEEEFDTIMCCCAGKKCDSCYKSFMDKYVVGDMLDRHLFSMFCYENFASLHHLPYIWSVFKMTGATYKKPKRQDLRHLYESMLYQWCHEDNFSSTFLVKIYFSKHIATACLSFLMAISLVISFSVIAEEIGMSETFRCQLPYHDICLLCTIQRKRDLIAMMACNLVICIILSITSFVYWQKLKYSSRKQQCQFFETLQEKSNVALSVG